MFATFGTDTITPPVRLEVALAVFQHLLRGSQVFEHVLEQDEVEVAVAERPASAGEARVEVGGDVLLHRPGLLGLGEKVDPHYFVSRPRNERREWPSPQPTSRISCPVPASLRKKS